MTRDEAVRIVNASMHKTYPEAWVDNFVALGMLKLDEPKSVYDRICDLMANSKIAQGEHHERVIEFHKALAATGLKIVEARK